MTRDSVRAYYAQFGEREWERLVQPTDGAVEYSVNRRLLAAHLPSTGRVLDLGGGPGRYTIWLAQRGYTVTLVDLSPNLLAIAREQIAQAGVADQVEAIVEADACDLSRWDDGSFAAVLCLGPFYHLPEAADRARAASELARVLQPGGVAAVALMPRLSFIRRTLALADERQHLLDPEFITRLLDQGVFKNDIPGRLTSGYGVDPSDVAPFFARFGFQLLLLASSEGISVGIAQALADMQATAPDLYERALDLIVQTASDPSILGMANHLLYIG
ncbi:MAG: class I SAM-dependent methyltransferase, partial [Ktedonobacterales bacterium]